MQDIHIFNRWTGQWWTQRNKARCVCVQTSWMFHSITNSPDWSTPRFIRPHLRVSPRWENSYFSAMAITRSSAHRSSPSPQPRLGRISQPVGFAQTSTAWLRHSFTPKWLHDIQASEDREARCPGAPTCQSRSLKSAAGLDARHHGGPEQRSEAGSVTAGTPEVGFKSSLPAVHMWKECEIYKARPVPHTITELSRIWPWNGASRLESIRDGVCLQRKLIFDTFVSIEFALKTIATHSQQLRTGE